MLPVACGAGTPLDWRYVAQQQKILQNISKISLRFMVIENAQGPRACDRLNFLHTLAAAQQGSSEFILG
jgi:hypothetical protein